MTNVKINLSDLSRLTLKEKILLSKLLKRKQALKKDIALKIPGDTNKYFLSHEVTAVDIGMGPGFYVVGEGEILANGGFGQVDSFQNIIFNQDNEDQILVIEKSIIRKTPLNSNLSENEKARIQNEAKTSQFLLLAGGVTQDNQIYMEKFSGKDLTEVNIEIFNNLSSRDCLEILINFIRQLSVFHSRKLVHRDIKYDNVIFDDKTKALRIIDTGCSDDVDGNKRSGTHCFFPPEYDLYVSCMLNNIKIGNVPKSSFALDIYQAGYIFAQFLFEELVYDQEQIPFKIQFEKINVGNLRQGLKQMEPSSQKKLCDLVIEMFDHEPKNRPKISNISQTLDSIYESLSIDEENAIKAAQQQVQAIQTKFVSNLQSETTKNHVDNYFNTIIDSSSLNDLTKFYFYATDYYEELNKGFKFIDNLNLKIEADNNHKVKLEPYKDKVIACITTLSDQFAMEGQFDQPKKNFAESIGKIWLDYNKEFCNANLLIVMHQRFVHTQYFGGDKNKQRADFIALTKALFDTSNQSSFKKAINKIEYQEKHLFNRNLEYLNLRNSLMNCTEIQLHIIKETYQAWLRNGNELEKLSVLEKFRNNSLASHIEGIKKSEPDLIPLSDTIIALN